MIGQLRVTEALEAELRAVCIALELHNASLCDLPERDALTGLANRHRFEETLAFDRARRSGLPL